MMSLDVQCNLCKRGHLKADCRKKKRDEQHNRSSFRGGRSGADSSSNTVAAFGASKEWKQEWVLDSGASRHLTGNRELLINLRRINRPNSVTFANGTVGRADYPGDTFLEAANGRYMLLREVLYIPTAAANLFSISTAIQHGAKFHFGPTDCAIQQNGGGCGLCQEA